MFTKKKLKKAPPRQLPPRISSWWSLNVCTVIMFTKRSREFPKKTSKTHLFRPIFINFRPNRDNVLFAAWTMQKPKEKPRISFSQNQVIICKNYLVIHGSKRWEKKQTSSLKVSGSSPKSDVLPLGTQLLRISNYPGGCGCFWARNGYFEHIDLRLRLDFGSQVFSNMYWEFLIFVALDLFLLSHVCWLIWKKLGK